MGRDPDHYPEGSPFRAPEKAPLLERTIPLAKDLPGYRPPTASRDIIAGLTVAALALPAAMAYAELAGLSPVRGLYGLLLPGLLYAVLGSSRPLSVGPEGSLAALIAAAVLPLAVAGSDKANQLGTTLAVLVALFFFLAWALRLGWVSDYLSRPVLIGYIHGVAVVLIISQLGKLLGLSLTQHDAISQIGEILDNVEHVSGLTALIGFFAVAVLLTLGAVVPRFPSQLVVVVAAIAGSYALDLKAHGVPVVGSIPAGLPSVGLPSPSVTDVIKLLPAAAGIFFLCFADEILTARSFAGKRDEHIRGSQELIAMGAANAAAGLTGAFPVGASGSRTAVNDTMGARTQVSGIVSAATALLILLFLTGPVAYLPKAVLGAVIVSAAVGLVSVPAWRGLIATDRVEVAIAAVTMASVIIIGVLEAVVLAIGLSLIDVVRRSARPHDAVLGWVDRLGRYGNVALYRDAQVTPGIVVYRLDDRLFFANARYVKGRIREAIYGAPSPARWLVLDAEAITHVDASGLEALTDIVRSLRVSEIGFAVARLKGPARRHFDEAGLTELIGSDRFFGSVHVAVEACRHELPIPAGEVGPSPDQGDAPPDGTVDRSRR